MERLRVHDIVMTSHDACTTGTSRDFTVTSLQRLKMEALIRAPADCEVQSAIKSLNAQSTVPIEIYHIGLVFGRLRVKIPVMTKIIGFFLSVVKANAVLNLYYDDPFNRYS